MNYGCADCGVKTTKEHEHEPCVDCGSRRIVSVEFAEKTFGMKWEDAFKEPEPPPSRPCPACAAGGKAVERVMVQVRLDNGEDAMVWMGCTAYEKVIG